MGYNNSEQRKSHSFKEWRIFKSMNRLAYDAVFIRRGAKQSVERRICRNVSACGSDINRGYAILAKIDRKSTRLNSSHMSISYAVFCLKKKNQNTTRNLRNLPMATASSFPQQSECA